MNPTHPGTTLWRGLIATALLVLGLAVGIPPAQGDIGFESSSRAAGAPGERVRLTIGCGFCFPSCVGEPGRRHPPGDLDGTCMLGNRAGPPAAFPIWITPLGHSLSAHRCEPGGGCAPAESRPPRLPSFTYLGRAVRVGLDPDDPYPIPRYRLRFRVPPLRAGDYKYVLFCDTCVAGLRGSLIDGSLIASTESAGRLRVLPSGDASGAPAGAGPWIAAGALVATLGLGAGLFRRRGRAAVPAA